MAFAGTARRRPHMPVEIDIVTVAITVLLVLLLAVGAEEVMGRRRSRDRAEAPLLPSEPALGTVITHHARGRPGVGLERSLIKIVAVYRTSPVMVVGETADGALLECALHELTERPELLPPGLWQELGEQYQGFQEH
jgi:hypothetical protein